MPGLDQTGTADMDPAREGAWAPVAEVWLLDEDSGRDLAETSEEAVAFAGIITSNPSP